LLFKKENLKIKKKQLKVHFTNTTKFRKQHKHSKKIKNSSVHANEDVVEPALDCGRVGNNRGGVDCIERLATVK